MTKKQLLDAINKTAHLFIEEFSNISNAQKDILIDNVDNTPAQMISYQLGWLKLVKSWDDMELIGQVPTLPAKGYKWNRLGELNQTFYETYSEQSIEILTNSFIQEIKIWNIWIESLSEEILFIKDQRDWTKPYRSHWTVAKFIHINSVAPFKTFRTKIRKWKKYYAIHHET